MNNNLNNIPAFPRPGFTASETESQEGMILRDWFAGMALQALIASPEIHLGTIDNYAKRAYTYADSMLSERNDLRSRKTPVPPRSGSGG